MIRFFALIQLFILFTATSCINQGKESADIESTKVSPEVFGLSLGTVTIKELEAFAAGKDLPILEGNLPPELIAKARTAMTEKFSFVPEKASDAFRSPEGKKLVKLLGTFIINRNRDDEIPKTLIKAASDGTLSFMELVKLYPDQELKIDTVAFAKDNKIMLEMLKNLQNK